MMRTLFPTVSLAITFTVAASGGVHAQAPSAAPIDVRTRAELVQAREAVWRAWFQGDSAALVRLLPERMTAMDRDRSEIIADARRFVTGGGKYLGIDFTKDQFFVNGNVAVVWSRYDAHITDAEGNPTKMAGRAIEVFVHQGGRWINPHWHLDAER